MKAVMKYILVILCMFVQATYALDQTETGFFCPIGKENFEMDNGWWLSKDPDYFSGKYHIGVDMMTRSLDAKVYAIADGKVTYVSRDTTEDGSNWGIGNCALGIQHKTSDGTVFTAVYGHLQCSSIPARNTDVYAGKPIGKTGPWSGGIHLHFGIVPASSLPRSNWGKMPVSEWNSTNSFIDPVEFIQTHYAYNPSIERQVACQGDICWSPKNAGSCEAATSWYKGSGYPAVGDSWMFEVGNYVCNELQSTFTSVAAAENPSEAIPDGNSWHSFVRFIRSLLGETASAQELAQTMSKNWTINTINVYTGNVVAGNASKAIHGAGQGYPIQAITPPIQVPPDFIVTKTWLETPWGTEVYRFGMNESFDTKAQSKNIGDGPCVSGETDTIIGHFYLSKGYKMDPSSGNGARRRVDSTTTRCDNLKPGNTHTETKNTVIGQWISKPGIYNIVYCIDHPRDDHNSGGDHREKHESNNCSTEAVFEVTADSYVNVPETDLTVSAIRVKGNATQLPAGGVTNLQMAIRNIGTVTPASDIRSSYSFCGPLPGTSCAQVADDQSYREELTPNRDQWEETKAPIRVPSAPGSYLLKGCADSLNNVNETDEANNCTTSMVSVVNPVPDFIVGAMGLREGLSIKKGTRVHPWCTVQNMGGPSPSAIRLAYYINADVYRDSDTVEAYELCAGCSKFEEVQNNDIKLGDKGTRTYRCCVDYQGAVAESNEGNNCATMSFTVR